ncbi:MAG: hypothetical protein KJO29_03815, partial [Bacteroidia bacterium]|nr:hypothetical protein [Bacteroidia bacterium]
LEDWHNPKPSIAKKIKSVIDSSGIKSVAHTYADLKSRHPDKYDWSENQLNQLGYYYLGKDENENAMAIFKLNIDAYPEAFNTYDSYGEALLVKGDTLQSIDYYRKSVQLNPGNENGIKILNNLGVSTDDLFYDVPVDQLKELQGLYISTEDPEWSITLDLENEELIANDRGYKYKLVPIDENSFVNADDGASLVFNLKEKFSKTMILSGKFKFKKI